MARVFSHREHREHRGFLGGAARVYLSTDGHRLRRFLGDSKNRAVPFRVFGVKDSFWLRIISRILYGQAR
jgi:hypothetical protein